MIELSKIFEDKFASVFDNMDKAMVVLNEASENQNQEEEQPQGGGEQEQQPQQEAPQQDPTMPEAQQEEPADQDSGIYVSSNEKATLAKTMLDALQATPPKPGEIPEKLLNVTNVNADEVIKYIQSLVSLTNSVSLADNGDKSGLVDTLKDS